MAAVCDAQQGATEPQQQATATIQVQTRLVVLDVVVTDKHGEMRNDLKQEDFTVTEDGTPQRILNFEPPAAHVLPPGLPIHSTAELEERAPQAPVNVVVLDELNTRFEDMAYARYALKKYLTAQPGELQTPTMLIAVSAHRLQVLKDYSQDREAILAALQHHLAAYPWHLDSGTDRIRQLALSLGALEQVAQATAGHPAHKNLLWIGHGFPGITLAGGNMDQSSADGITTAVQQALNMLRDSRITLYTVDPTALSSSVTVRIDADSAFADEGTAAADPFAGDVQFTALAAATGGKSFFSRNDVDREIAESARDGANFYTLTYKPTGGSDAAQPYRRIRIKFRKPHLAASFRDGYYTRNAPAPVLAAKRTAYDIDSATENTMVYTGLSVSAIAKPGAPGVYLIGVPQRELVWADDSDKQITHLKVAAATFNARGKILSRVSEDLTEHRPIANITRRTGLARMEILAPPGAGATRIRFVVLAEGGAIGTVDVMLPERPNDGAQRR
jgi:VWFA-related protein